MSHLVLLEWVPLLRRHVPRGVKNLDVGVPEVGVQPLGGHDGLVPWHRVETRGGGGGGLRHGGRRGVAARRDPEGGHRRGRRPAPEPRGARPSDPALGEEARAAGGVGGGGGAREERGRHGFWKVLGGVGWPGG